MNWEWKWNLPPSLQHQASWSLLEAAPALRFLAACNRHKLAISWAEGVLIYLLVATTLLMKSAILMVTADVVPSPSFQSSFIWPPIPDKVTLMVIMVGIAKVGILDPSLGYNNVTAMVILIMIAIETYCCNSASWDKTGIFFADQFQENVKNAKVSKSTLVNESKSKSHSPAGREYFKFVKLSTRKTKNTSGK